MLQVSQQLAEKTGAFERPSQANAALQQAFQQGAEYAAQQIAEQQAEQQQAVSQLGSQQQLEANDEQERKLRERIEALQRREYRAPVQPLACKDERAAALACFRGVEGASPGEVVTQCQKMTEELDKCAALLRDASMAKILPGTLKS